MKVRRIGGLQFALVHTCRLKKDAKGVANDIRRGGYNARVKRGTKTSPWQVWPEVV